MCAQVRRAAGKHLLEASVGWREQKSGCDRESEQCEERRRDRKATFCGGVWVEEAESRVEESWGRDGRLRKDPEGGGSALRRQGGEGGAPSDSFLVFFWGGGNERFSLTG